MVEQTTDFGRWLADLLSDPNPTPGTMAADLQASAKRDGITEAGMRKLIQELGGHAETN